MPADGQPPPPPPGPPSGRPEYKVYKSRRGLGERLRGSGIGNPLERFRRGRKPDGPPGLPKPSRRITPGRVIKWIVLAILGWVLLSVALFFISAALQDGVSSRTERALASGGSLATGSNVLVIGSDARPEDTKEPEPEGGFGQRADSILLLHVGVGTVRRLSILRDTYVETDEYTGRLNGAYSGGGGAARLVKVLEEFLGNDIEINHVIEVDFENFPDFIDAVGGVDVKVEQRCIRSPRFGGTRVNLRRGEHHLDGEEALAFARVRKNSCNPREDDRARAARQQQVLSGIRERTLPWKTPSSLIRLPVIAWNAPRTVKSDMQGPGLSMLFFDLLTGGSGKTRVLRFDGINPDGTLQVSAERRREEVDRLLGND